ncbi:MAG: serine hydrolase domain-containing protein [Pseudomonadota bacterium]
MRFIVQLAGLVILFLHLGAASAAHGDLVAKVDAIFKSTANAPAPGCALGLRYADQPIMTRAYGQTDLEHGISNTPDTIFEAGSVSKQFTAAAILLLAQDGKLSLSDSVHKYLPELPDYGSRISIDHLLTHTSGLRDWGSLVEIAGWPRGTRAVTMEQALALIVRQRSLNFTPGTEYSYSNTGYVLAALIVQRISGQSLAEFTRKRMFVPLGMSHTSWRDNFRRVVPQRAIAYSKEGDGYEQDMPFEDVYGHGGLLSSVGDLLIWNEALKQNKLGSEITQQLQHQATLSDGRLSDYGHGLFMQEYLGVKEISHGGATAGYRTWLGRFPQHDLSIALLCNSGDAKPGRMAHELAQAILALPGAPILPAVPLAFTDAALAGSFFNQRNATRVNLTYRDGQLMLPGDTLLRQTSANSFAVKSGTFIFAGHDNFIARAPGSETTGYQRVTGAMQNLSTYSGRYRNDEVMVTYEVSPESDKLAFRLSDKPDTVFHLAPLAADTFGGDDIVVRFKRNAAKKIIGASVSSERMFDLAFQRKAD